MTLCLQQYIVKEVGCEIDWFKNTSYKNCSEFEFGMIQETLNWMIDASYDEFVSETGCMQKCNFMEYRFVKKIETDITWNITNWISEFYVYSNSEHVELRYLRIKNLYLILILILKD